MQINPQKLGNFPTPIEPLERLKTSKNLYIKRDDYSGMELSGNKVRKLEYVMSEAIQNGAQVILTAGAIQSNHCRATAAACRKLGLACHLFLFGDQASGQGGNLLLDHLLGVPITYVDPQDYDKYLEIMHDQAKVYQQEGKKTAIVPIGASYGIGNFGYIKAYKEIIAWEEATGKHLDTIVCTVGSGGTFAGLWLGNMIYGKKHKVIGIAIASDADTYKKRIREILKETLKYDHTLKSFQPDINISAIAQEIDQDFIVLDGYQGKGYAIPYEASIKRIQMVAQTEGIIFDPVYTGKAFHGMMCEIEKEHDSALLSSKNILFIHTGGLFGAFSFEKWF